MTKKQEILKTQTMTEDEQFCLKSQLVADEDRMEKQKALLSEEDYCPRVFQVLQCLTMAWLIALILYAMSLEKYIV